MHYVPLNLESGSDLLLSIKDFAKIKNCSGFVLGVVGNLSKVSIQCPGQKEPTILNGNLEIITLNGTFSPEGVHLHLSISDSNCHVFGGHLEAGSTILKMADILLGILSTKTINSKVDHVNNPRVEIYVLPGCPWSKRAVTILKSNQITYIEKIIRSDEDFNQISEKSSLNTFPQIFVDGKLLGGYDSLAALQSSGELVKLAGNE